MTHKVREAEKRSKAAKAFEKRTGRKARRIRGGRKGSEKEKKRIESLNKKKTVTKLPTIEAKKKPSLIQRFAKTKIGKIVTSPITTGVLAGTLATIATRDPRIGAAVGRGATAVITRTAFRGKTSLTTQRAFTGQGTKKSIERIFKVAPKTAPVAARFASTSKSKGLSTSMVSKLGLTIGAAGLFVGAVGSYPFAGFIKEEALQTLGFAFNTAERNRDVEGMEKALANVEEIINGEESILSKIPYANIIVQLRSFFRAAQTKLETDRRRLETLRAEGEAGETEFQASQSEARQTQLEQRERDAEYFALIREGKFEEAEELLQSELKGGN